MSQPGGIKIALAALKLSREANLLGLISRELSSLLTSLSKADSSFSLNCLCSSSFEWKDLLFDFDSFHSYSIGQILDV